MSMFKKQRLIETPMVKLHREVSFKNKNDAKNKGAKWNPDTKQWYFQYELLQFIDNPDLHTYEFEPTIPSLVGLGLLTVNYTGDKNIYNSKTLFNIVYDRYKKFNNIVDDYNLDD